MSRNSIRQFYIIITPPKVVDGVNFKSVNIAIILLNILFQQ